MPITILGIESSCDDTSAAVIKDKKLLANVIANQDVHKKYGGVIPELASRAHQSNIVPVVDTALKQANITLKDIDAIAFTRGPGLLGSLLVGTSFAKGLSLAINKPIIEVNHLQGHILSLFINDGEYNNPPELPFLCLLVSGGHTQIVKVEAPLKMEILGSTIDDAAGEAFDKVAKMIGLPYPGGPEIDRLAQEGDSEAFNFAKPKIKNLDYSFSGFKTSVLYFLRDKMKIDPDFIKNNLANIAASAQKTIIDILIDKFENAIYQTGIKNIAIAGGVAANSGLQKAIKELANKIGGKAYIPPRKYTTDNAAMIAIAGYYKFLEKDFAPITIEPKARYKI
jgi:N6-L-threonylcarbamoyladenine synthase